MEPQEISQEFLTEHAAFLRRLARGLLGDEQLAEDACQDAVLATLRRPAPQHVSPVAWLTAITRRAALSLRRRSRERAEHEADAVRESEAQSSEHFAVRSELLLEVARAVAELPEPYRAAILARYYEGLSTAEIAARDGLSTSTVKSRLARAQERLRERFDRTWSKDRDDWRTDLAALCGLPGASVAKTAITMGTALKLTLGGAAVVLLAVGAWRAFEQSTVAEPVEVAAPGATRSESASPPLAANATAASPRNVVPGASQGVADRVLLWGEVRGADPEELRLASITFLDRTGLAREARIGEPASYSLFGLLPGSYRAVARVRGYAPLDESITVPAGASKLRHDLEFRRAFVVPVKFVDARTGERFVGFETMHLGVAATRERPARLECLRGRRAAFSEAGRYRSADELPDGAAHAGISGMLEVFAPLPIVASLGLREVVLESRLVTGAETELVFRIEPAALETNRGSLDVVCLDSRTGLPIAGLAVDIGLRDMGLERARTDDAGHARFDGLPPGLCRATVRDKRFAMTERWLRVEPGRAPDPTTIELVPTARVTGRVVDPTGKGLVASMTVLPLRVVNTPLDLDSRLSYSSATDGSFDMPWVESGELRLVAKPKHWALATLDVKVGAAGELHDLEIRAQAGTVVVFRPPGGMDSCEFLLADDGGNPLLFAGAHDTMPYRMMLAPGRYQVSTLVDERVHASRTVEVVESAEPLLLELP